MLPTLEEYILMIDNHQLGWNGFEYYNEACKEEDLQLRNWLQELRVRRRSCKTYKAAMRKVNPKTEAEAIEELIKENEELKAKLAVCESHEKELQGKHWNECRQIAHYSNEATQGINQWISVDDKLPDDDITVLVWYTADSLFGRFGDYGVTHYRKSSGWSKASLIGDDQAIFYWMPLPEQPKEERE